ncbi:spirocyclase AveC family protein [Conexibacter sp. SYSU D00693]|uniref:spirocyclase AveC family protein n=1 Tax=Conexibacter sp. SYSU D00693 TaxID=2812560 RepID=UPI00196A37F2|nr:spirocyclase AveC family protein [Conexibacter sp. SYSU D00693]
MAISGPIAPARLQDRLVRLVDRAVEVGDARTPPIKVLALLGALLVAFMAYVWVSWIAGPYFERVPAGPSDAPGWMTTTFAAWQAGGLVAVVACYWFFVVRPWRRDGRPTTDGLLVIACSTLWFQDPLSSYFGHWFTYNAELVNFGSWVHEVPGWLAPGEPGAMVPEPILLIGPVYVYFIMVATLLGCAMMRAAKRRWPGIRPWGLMAVCFVGMCLVDLVAEGLVWLPLGFWEYPGGPGLLFPSTYHKFPINEMLTIGSLFTAVCALRYFKDDRGHTLVERGLEQVRGGVGRQTVLRILAVTFAMHAIMFVTYNLPNAFVGAHSRPWPEDLQKRSYLTNGVCGDGTDRLCPGPGVPNARGNSAAYLDTQGRLVLPPGTELPRLVPFDRGAPGGTD